jgi:ubiquinone/menaquinone biosynthesis C-methylase UbiE
MSAPVDPLSASIDAEAKRIQRDQWNVAASAWLRWWSVFEGGAQVVNDELCDMARIGPSMSVLDLASGLGEPAISAARRVGRRGSVLGVDLSPQMVAFARERAAEAAATNVRFEEGDGEDLRVEPASFDAALSRWGLMLMPRPDRAAAGVRRALKAGGSFAAAVWSTPDEVPFIAVPHGIAQRELGIPPPDPDTPGPLRMGQAGMLESCLAAAGFGAVESRIVPLTITFASVDQWIAFQRDMSGALKRALETQSAAVQERTWGLLADATQRFADEKGVVRFENRCRLAVGTA